MKNTNEFSDSHSSDPVIREMALVASYILSDMSLTKAECARLIGRLEIEYHAYKAWKKQYASYFRTPRSPKQQRAQNSNKSKNLGIAISGTTKTALIRVFADFGGFTHSIRHPKDYLANPDRYPHLKSLLSPSLSAMLDDWVLEFSKFATDDFFNCQYGRMLWISFDIAGIEVCKAIKQHVGSLARVVYLKPDEDPFAHYQYAREIMDDGSVHDLPGDIEGR